MTASMSSELALQLMLTHDPKPIAVLPGPVAVCSSGVLNVQLEALFGSPITTVAPDPVYL